MDNKDWMNQQLGADRNGETEKQKMENIASESNTSEVTNQGNVVNSNAQERKSFENVQNSYTQNQNGFHQGANPYMQNQNGFGQNSYTQNQNGYGQRMTPYGQNQNAQTNYGAYTQSVQKKMEEDKQQNQKQGGKYVVKRAAGIALAGVLFGAVAGGTFLGVAQLQNGLTGQVEQISSSTVETKEAKETETKATVTQSDGNSVAKAQTAATVEAGMTVQEIATSGMKSVVAITNVGVSEIQTMWGNIPQESTSTGSGIIIGQTETELLIVTNYHVVQGSNELSVVFSYDEKSDEPNAVKAKIKGYDSERDLAVIAIPTENLTDEIMNEICIATVGKSDELKLGDQVVAIGNALGYGQSVTVGYVSALDRIVELQNEDGSTSANSFIQTDAAINPGNSGGALFNMKGELVGINSVKVAESSVEGMGYAIPITEVSDIIGDLMNSVTRDLVEANERGYLGVSGRTVDSATSQAYGIPVGAYVSEVADNSAAKKAGIQNGDIITKFDNKTVGTFENLQNIIRYYKAGESVKVVVMRQSTGGYKEVELELTLCSAEEAGVSVDSSQSNTQDQYPSSDYGQNPNNGNGYDDYYSNPFRFFFGN